MIVLPIEWNVAILTSSSKRLNLSFNSSVAFLVKETINILSASTFCFSTKYFTFASIVVVFPAPAPAITSV